MSTFTLPYPPSANRIWRNVGGKTLKSAEYRQWLSVAIPTIIHQRPEPVAGKYDLTVVATRPDNRGRDLDNLLKPVSDAIVQAGVVHDDQHVQNITIGWSEEGPIKGGAILVVVEPWASRKAVAA